MKNQEILEKISIILSNVYETDDWKQIVPLQSRPTVPFDLLWSLNHEIPQQFAIDLGLKKIAAILVGKNGLFNLQKKHRLTIESRLRNSDIPRNLMRDLIKKENEIDTGIEKMKKYFSELMDLAKAGGYETFERSSGTDKYQIYFSLEVSPREIALDKSQH